jgi:hypothetical protein
VQKRAIVHRLNTTSNRNTGEQQVFSRDLQEKCARFSIFLPEEGSMESLYFWLHMDENFMCRWCCFDNNRALLARSAESYFSRDEANAAIKAAKARMIQAAAA